ncbi:hypothetical protein H1Z61_09740 [Bacillus aquiflavi]|uniref:Uncharacterized protein n=1 Tax=Bacillus aquiflavi TaxID=2672567 RepID=A0A7W1X4F4_9BACI|nr:hypothetical protein [Bacillus aquiflavi]MBA4537401.1 hypothetical protein [Bacillus aquiflavi]UAC47654.1 hypothetical protein K6959_13455 [Bacillus aquiflavi]
MGRNKEQTHFKPALFEAADGKILAIDMFRGPYPGAFSNLDFNSPEYLLKKKNIKQID